MSCARVAPILSILSAISLYGSASAAQDVVPTQVTDQNRSGDLPFSSAVGSDLERVVISTENLVVNIPIAHVRGRAGLDFDFGLHYDGRVLAVIPPSGSNPAIWRFSAHNYVPSNGIWQTNQPTLSFSYYSRQACVDLTQGSHGSAAGQNGFVLQDERGAAHALDIGFENAECPNGNWSYLNSGPDTDDSGFWATIDSANHQVTVRGPNGTIFGGGNGNTITTPPGQTVLVYGSYEDSTETLPTTRPRV